MYSRRRTRLRAAAHSSRAFILPAATADFKGDIWARAGPKHRRSEVCRLRAQILKTIDPSTACDPADVLSPSRTSTRSPRWASPFACDSRQKTLFCRESKNLTVCLARIPRRAVPNMRPFCRRFRCSQSSFTTVAPDSGRHAGGPGTS
jgi:hypothetical protein